MADRLPNSDPDLTLAQQIEKLRKQGRSLSELDDPLMQHLLAYKKQKHQVKPAIDDKQAVWNQIEDATKPGEKAQIFNLRPSSAVRWAAAAVVVIAAIFSFIYFRGSNKPKLLAASMQAIKTVTLNDGSKITLRPHSKLFSLEKGTSKAVYKLKGEALFDVTHNPKRIFTVKTQSGAVSVLGTRFILSSWGHRMKVYLQRGKVKVEAPEHADSVIIQPGEAALVTRHNPIKVVQKAPEKEYTDWISQQLVFDNEAASQVIAEVEQQFDITISLPEKIARKRISGQLSLKELQPILDNLALVLNGSFKKTNAHSYSFKSSSL